MDILKLKLGEGEDKGQRELEQDNKTTPVSEMSEVILQVK
jgi:hypothetical protein